MRNSPCPCGSGRKYKACCGRLSPEIKPAIHGDRRPAAEVPGELVRLVALMEAGRYAELEGAARELLTTRPGSGPVWQLLGIALAKQGKDAVPALENAARVLPDDAVAHLNLGNALGRRGRLTEARASYARALAIRPAFAEAHNNLADVQLELGQFLEAAVSCRHALAIRPDFAEAHQNLGKALLGSGQIDEALQSCRRAIDIRPDFAAAQVSLANALRSIGRLDEAAAGYRRALAIRPDFVSAHTELATALRLQRRTEDSEASCRNALRINPDSAPALAVLAELWADSGRFAEAEDLFQRIISIDPESAEAWAGLARLGPMTAADETWLAAAQRLAGQGLVPQRELLLRYAIGKYFDDIGEFDRAFQSYRHANELAKQCGPVHDRNELARSIDLIIRSHDDAWVSGLASAANPSTRPVFIVGMLRSGTTLAEQILASHPAVFGAGELTFWSGKSAAAIAGARAVNAQKIAMSDGALAALGSEYLELLRQQGSADALRTVDKLPTNFLFLGLIHAVFPHARIIHMRRNPIDTCLSIYFQHFEAVNTYANDLHDLAHYYGEYCRLMRHWRTILPHAMLDVPYEGLVEDPAVWSRKMLEFVGLPWDPRCLDFHRTVRPVVTASRWQVRQKITTASVGRWRHYEKFVGPLKALLESDSLSLP